MKRLLEIILNGEGTVGGEQRHVLQLIDALDPAEYAVDVITWDIPAFTAELESRGVRTTSVVANRILDGGLERRIEADIRGGAYDLVHAHGHRAGLLGRFAAVRARTPRLVWTCHLAENKSGGNPVVRAGYRRAMRYLDRRTDATIAVSPILRDWLVGEGIAERHIEVVPNGVDTSVFAPSNPDPALAAELGLRAGVPVVGTIARLTEQKGVETLVEAAALVAREVPDVQFLVVGAGPLEESLRARAREIAGAEGPQIVFAGERSDIPQLLSLLDVAVVPSLWEGAFCYTLLESMASGTPVACSDIEMFTQVVNSGAEAEVFKVGDPASLSSAILMLLRDRERAQRVGRAGRELVEQRFSARHSSGQTIAVYERLLAGGRN